MNDRLIKIIEDKKYDNIKDQFSKYSLNQNYPTLYKLNTSIMIRTKIYKYVCGRCGRLFLNKSGFFNTNEDYSSYGHANKNQCELSKASVSEHTKDASKEDYRDDLENPND